MINDFGRLLRALAGLLSWLALVTPVMQADQVQGLTDLTLLQAMKELVANERDAAGQKPPFLYTSFERSERTGGHLWTERVAEISEGKLRYLIAEDGQPLTAERHDAEIARLKAIAANPSEFIRHEQSRKNDERHVQEMLALLPRAFLFTSSGNVGPWLRIDYRPNPAYVPTSYEERVLHSMSGYLLIDGKHLRLHHLEGELKGDVNFGYGLLATIRNGSKFSMTRDPIADGIWKTTAVDVQVDGRIVFLKSISRQQRSEHRSFEPLQTNLSVPRAVALLIK